MSIYEKRMPAEKPQQEPRQNITNKFEFSGLINFDDERALDNLARKIAPHIDKVKKTYRTV